MTTYYQPFFSPVIVDEALVRKWNKGVADPQWAVWTWECDSCKEQVGVKHEHSKKTFAPFWALNEDAVSVWCLACMSEHDRAIADRDTALEEEYARFLWETDRDEYRRTFGDADFIYETNPEPL